MIIEVISIVKTVSLLSFITLGVMGLMIGMTAYNFDKAYSSRTKWHFKAFKIMQSISDKLCLLAIIPLYITVICSLIILWYWCLVA